MKEVWVVETFEEIREQGASITGVQPGKQYAVLGLFTVNGQRVGDLQAIAYNDGIEGLNSFPQHTEVVLLEKVETENGLLLQELIQVVLLWTYWAPCSDCTRVIFTLARRYPEIDFHIGYQRDWSLYSPSSHLTADC